MTTTVIKGGGHRPSEQFNAMKLQNTLYAACLNVRVPEKSARETAQIVTKAVTKWANSKDEITSTDIKEVAIKYLKKYNAEAAYIYQQYNITI